jgi:hypothetical protein
MRSWLSLLIASAASSVIPVARAAPPAHVEIAYEVLRDGRPVADIVSRIDHDAKTYELSETWRGRGIYYLLGEARRASRGQVTAEGLRPVEFTDKRPGREATRATFDWSAGTLTLRHKGETSVRPLPASAHDRLTSLFGAAFYPPGTAAITLDVTDGRGVSTYVYRTAGRERVTTPAGEFDSVRLVKQRDAPDDSAAEIWLADRLGYLPVRVLVIDKDGMRADQLATRIAIRP